MNPEPEGTRGLTAPSEAIAAPTSHTLRKRYTDLLAETALTGHEAIKVGNLLGFLHFVGVDEERTFAEVMRLVDDDVGASFNQWLDALCEIYDPDWNGYDGHQRRRAFMEFCRPSRWGDTAAVDAWREAV